MHCDALVARDTGLYLSGYPVRCSLLLIGVVLVPLTQPFLLIMMSALFKYYACMAFASKVFPEDSFRKQSLQKAPHKLGKIPLSLPGQIPRL